MLFLTEKTLIGMLFTGSTYSYTEIWRWSDNAGSFKSGSGSNFSNDDGIWGAANGTLNGDSPGPSLSGSSGFGQQNYHSSDSSQCQTYFILGTKHLEQHSQRNVSAIVRGKAAVLVLNPGCLF